MDHCLPRYGWHRAGKGSYFLRTLTALRRRYPRRCRWFFLASRRHHAVSRRSCKRNRLILYFCLLITLFDLQVVSTFISHTIAAVLLVPIAKEVGSSYPGGDYQRLLIFLTGLLCSTGMGMPVSGFPNQTAYVASPR